MFVVMTAKQSFLSAFPGVGLNYPRFSQKKYIVNKYPFYFANIFVKRLSFRCNLY